MMINLSNNKGFTLLELIICLAILSILVTSFLGIQLSFSKFNKVSSLSINAGILAGNLYEEAKGMSIFELYETASSGIIWNNGIKFVIEAERYFYDNQSSNNNLIDLVINTDSMNNYNCYGYGDSLLELFTISGQESLRIDIYSDEHLTNIDFTDNKGEKLGYIFKTEKEMQTINIYTNSIEGAIQFLNINIIEQPKRNLEIYVYEYPLHKGSITIQYKDQSISTKCLIHPFEKDNVSIYP